MSSHLRNASLLTLIILFMFRSGYSEPSGRLLFKKNRCHQCHSIISKGIIADPSNSGAKDAPDLSKTEQKGQNALIAYLKKKKAFNGKKHEVRFKGKMDELKALTAWLRKLN